MTAGVLGLTKDTFDEAIGGLEVPEVVEFWAEW